MVEHIIDEESIKDDDVGDLGALSFNSHES